MQLDDLALGLSGETRVSLNNTPANVEQCDRVRIWFDGGMRIRRADKMADHGLILARASLLVLRPALIKLGLRPVAKGWNRSAANEK